MRDYHDSKAMAQTLRAALAAMGFKITVSQSLELIAQAFGVADWNTLSAAMRAEPAPVAENASGPAPSERPKVSGNPPHPHPHPRSGLSSELEAVLNRAFAYARGRKHDEITLEHLLLFLLDDADASRVVKGFGLNLDDLREKLTGYIDNNVKSRATDVADNPRPALGFQRVLQRAVFHVQQANVDQAGGSPVKSLNVLVAMFSEKESRAVNLMHEHGVTRMDVVNFIAHGTRTAAGGAADRSP